MPATTAESQARADVAGWLEGASGISRATADAALASEAPGAYCFRASSSSGVVAVLCYKRRDGGVEAPDDARGAPVDLERLGAVLAPSWGRLGPLLPSKSILGGKKIGANLE